MFAVRVPLVHAVIDTRISANGPVTVIAWLAGNAVIATAALIGTQVLLTGSSTWI